MGTEITNKRFWFVFLGLLLHLSANIAKAEHRRLAPERRRPLSKERHWIRGTDLTIKGIPTSKGTGSASCQSTLVAKKELDSPKGMCRLGYLTAAHCVDSSFESINFLGVGDIQKDAMTVSIPREYFRDGGASSREPRGGDSATIAFDIACDKVESLIPVPLAPVTSSGLTVINSNHVFLQKREEETTGNRGEGAQILADVKGTQGSLFRFHAPSPQGYTIVGGDSGGPIFNEKGELICPISGSSYEFMKENNLLTQIPNGDLDKVLDPFEVVCDKHAIARLRDDLAKLGLSPISTGEAEDLSEQTLQEVGKDSSGEPIIKTNSLKGLFDSHRKISQ